MFSLGRSQIASLIDDNQLLWLAPGEPQAGSTGAVVATSGSTSHPKLVQLSASALCAAAEAAQQLTGPLAWHLALPDHYVAGLMVWVRGVVAGRPVLRVSSDLADLKPTGEGDAISLVPTQLHRALRDDTLAAKLARFDLVLLGGAPLSAALRIEAESRGISIAESYGMSETCGGVVWDRMPLPGVAVRTDPHPSGRIELKGPMLFDGYLTTAGLAGGPVDGWFSTSDVGTFDGRLSVQGRIDDVVISGGVNVDLAAVRAVVSSLDVETDVFAVPDSEWGQRIVLAATSGTSESWRRRLGAELPKAALPKQLLLVEKIPRTAAGKPDRQRLLGLV